MSRAERFIPRSDEELQRIRQAEEDAQQFDRDRVELLRATLKRVKKAELVELTLRIAQEEMATEWMLEDELKLDKPVALLVHDVEVAIDIATKVERFAVRFTNRLA